MKPFFRQFAFSLDAVASVPFTKCYLYNMQNKGNNDKRQWSLVVVAVVVAVVVVV